MTNPEQPRAHTPAGAHAADERIAVIGMGAMGKRVANALRALAPSRCALCCLVPAATRGRDALKAAHGIEVFDDLDALLAWRPTLAIECAGHEAVAKHIVPLLERGVDAIVVSVGALASAPLHDAVAAAAQAGGATLTLVSGAIGGIDALRAARRGGLDRVRYTGRKPPRAWLGSAAETQCDLLALAQPTVIFEGSARESARLYPKNANVTAAVALAGVGFDDTAVVMIADPETGSNVHEIEATGAFGRLWLRLENQPLPDNPRTSWLAAMSIEEAVLRRFESSI